MDTVERVCKEAVQKETFFLSVPRDSVNALVFLEGGTLQMSFFRNPERWVALAASLLNKHSANPIYSLPLPAYSGLHITNSLHPVILILPVFSFGRGEMNNNILLPKYPILLI